MDDDDAEYMQEEEVWHLTHKLNEPPSRHCMAGLRF